MAFDPCTWCDLAGTVAKFGNQVIGIWEEHESSSKTKELARAAAGTGGSMAGGTAAGAAAHLAIASGTTVSALTPAATFTAMFGTVPATTVIGPAAILATPAGHILVVGAAGVVTAVAAKKAFDWLFS